MTDRIPSYPGQWIDASQPNRIDQALTGMMAGQPSALVWVGVKADGRPVHVLTQDGQRHEIQHEPIDTFGERLHSLVGSQSAGDQGAGSSPSLDPSEVYARRADVEASRAEPEHEESRAAAKTDDPFNSDSVYAKRAGIE